VFDRFSDHWQQTLGWQPDSEQEQGFNLLYNLVLEGNQTQNLTRITTPEDFWEKHLWDSLRGVLPFWDQRDLKVIDIGTGAGFPGLPISIAQPTWQLTLLDSRHKKTAFIATTAAAMGLKNITAVTGRAEDISQSKPHAHAYDLALIRAVGNAGLCAQYALPFVKLGGFAVLYRGQWNQAEQDDLQQACRSIELSIVQLQSPNPSPSRSPSKKILKQSMQINIDRVESFTTPLTHSARHCVYLGVHQNLLPVQAD